jgi:hypothetical protein
MLEARNQIHRSQEPGMNLEIKLTLVGGHTRNY